MIWYIVTANNIAFEHFRQFSNCTAPLNANIPICQLPLPLLCRIAWENCVFVDVDILLLLDFWIEKNICIPITWISYTLYHSASTSTCYECIYVICEFRQNKLLSLWYLIPWDTLGRKKCTSSEYDNTMVLLVLECKIGSVVH